MFGSAGAAARGYGSWPLRDVDPAASLLVRFIDGPASAKGQAAIASVGGLVNTTYGSGTSLLQLGQGVDASVAMIRLRADPEVAFVEANSIIHVASTTPNDPSFSSQWDLTQGNGIDAQRAWDITQGSASTVVAVVDTGVDMTHPDLAGKLWTNPTDGSHGYNFVANTNSPQDDNGHGTHIAGTIAAETNNSVGVAGINWNAKIMALKFLDSSGNGSTSAAVAAIDWAADHGAKVINASWGGSGSDPALSAAIAYADSKGVVFVAAAGNSGTNNDSAPFYPAAYHLPNMLTVAAVDSNDSLANFSNYGATTVDVAAPGVGIFSTYVGGGYTTMSGTSMAAPHVTGLVSLLSGQFPNDTPEQLVALVKASVRPLAGLSGKVASGGIVDAYNALIRGGAAAGSARVGLLDGATPITSAGTDAFGSTIVGQPITHTFTVTNSGNGPLILSGTIAVPVGFSVARPFGATTVAPGATTTFTIALTAASIGTVSGPVTFATNDPATPVFRFNIAGTVAPSGNSATFLNLDTATQGTWKGVYGGDGSLVLGDTSALPTYATVAPIGAAPWTWQAPTTDPRGLQTAAGARTAACWFGWQFGVDVNVTDGQSHRLTIYAADWDSASRAERVDLIDPATGATLDSRAISSFRGGDYLSWTISGHVQLRFTTTSGPNAVLGGLFFGGPSTALPVSPVPGASAAYLGSDATTQGTWKGVYGGDGSLVLGDTSALPTYATVAPIGAAPWTWQAPTTDPRGLQTAAGARTAACWFGWQFGVDVNVTDGQSHRLTIYAADWDSASRAERVDLIDPATGATLDSRAISSFRGGDYLSWTISGHVQLRFTTTSGPNAVLGGLFFG